MNTILSKVFRYYTGAGVKGVIAFGFAKVTGTTPSLRVDLPELSFPIKIRVATTDLSVMNQVLVEKHYDFKLPFQPSTIIDAGANIGLSAVYLANKYPNAKILALEPEPSNFRCLLENVRNYPQIKPLNAALWKTDGFLQLTDPGEGNHGFRTQESTQSSGIFKTQAYSIESLLKLMGWDSLDLLKIDIEGAEKEVFENSDSWIHRVKSIMAEVHEELQPGAELAFLEGTKRLSCEVKKGETILRLAC